MASHYHKRKKQPVAHRATPDVQIKQCPPPEALKSLNSASSVLLARHANLSWDVISRELGGGVDRGTLSRVARDKRDASQKLISKLNDAYGCHLHVKTIKGDIPVCPYCDEPYEPKHNCRNKQRRPRRVYDLSDKEARRIAVGLLGILLG